MRLPIRSRALVGVTLSLALLASACGGDDTSADGSENTAAATDDTATDDGAMSEGSEMASEGSEGAMASGTLDGAGASSQAAAMEGWIAGFQEGNPDVTVNYDPVGSGGGRETFLSGGVTFAGSDAYLDEDELAMAADRCAGDAGAVDLPHYVSPIAVAYNLPSVESLQLDAATIAGIFAGDITTWNDDAIAATNDGVELPDLPINPVHRSDDSGTTENFTDYLTQTAGDAWPYDVIETWPTEAGGEAAPQTSGVVQAVTAGEGSIGYADASQVGDLGTVAVQVGEEFVEYSPEAAAKILEVSEPAPDRPEGDFAYDLTRDTEEAGVYPIVLVSYHIMCNQYETQEEVDLVKAFMTYVQSEEGQAAAAEAAGSAPISQSLRDQVGPVVEAISVAG